jgi:hypothetical protein
VGAMSNEQWRRRALRGRLKRTARARFSAFLLSRRPRSRLLAAWARAARGPRARARGRRTVRTSWGRGYRCEGESVAFFRAT